MLIITVGEMVQEHEIISIHLMLMLIESTGSSRKSRTFISIHLMLMLISNVVETCDIFKYFNTSHVNVNHASKITVTNLNAFQYISC